MIVALATGPAIAAATKALIWLVGITYAWRFRRLLFAAAGVLALATSIVRGIIDSGGLVPAWLLDSVIYWSTPTAALIVAAFVAGRYPPIWVGRGWRL
jgi:uncharacterized membrane protein (Fun14 family)